MKPSTLFFFDMLLLPYEAQLFKVIGNSCKSPCKMPLLEKKHFFISYFNVCAQLFFQCFTFTKQIHWVQFIRSTQKIATHFCRVKSGSYLSQLTTKVNQTVGKSRNAIHFLYSTSTTIFVQLFLNYNLPSNKCKRQVKIIVG